MDEDRLFNCSAVTQAITGTALDNALKCCQPPTSCSKSVPLQRNLTVKGVKFIKLDRLSCRSGLQFPVYCPYYQEDLL